MSAADKFRIDDHSLPRLLSGQVELVDLSAEMLL